jgi:hypothetical protein
MDLFEEPAPLKDWASGRAGGPGRVIKREDESGEKSANE